MQHIWIILVFVLVPQAAFATIFDALGYVDGLTQPSWSIDGKIAGDLSGGNVESRSLSGDLASVVRPNRNVYALILQGGYEEASGAAYSKSTLIHGRHRIYINDWFGWENFAQHEFDEFRRIDTRALVGTGPRFAYDGDKVSLSVGSLPMYEYYNFRATRRFPAATEHTLRLSSYVRLLARIGGDSSIFVSGYYQPDVMEPRDYRGTASLGLNAPIVEWLSLQVGGNVAYDSVPPAGVEKLDYGADVALVVGIERVWKRGVRAMPTSP